MGGPAAPGVSNQEAFAREAKLLEERNAGALESTYIRWTDRRLFRPYYLEFKLLDGGGAACGGARAGAQE
jgi:hypothetical protein